MSHSTKKTSKVKDDRARGWTFLVYPESCVPDWRDKLREMCVEGAISPLHDRDINPTGEAKKPHYHVVLYFAGKKSYSQILCICNSLKATIPKTVLSMRSMIRYLTHIDNPEKAQYTRDMLEELGGFDTSVFFTYSVFEERSLRISIEEFIDEHHITEYADLCRMLRYDHVELYDFMTRKSTLHFKTYLASARWK